MADLRFQITGDDAKATAALNRVASNMEKLAEKSKTKFRDSMSSDVGAWITKLGGVLGVLSSIESGLNAITDAQKRAQETLSEQGRSFGALAQLAGGNTGQLQNLMGQARATYAEGGATSISQASQMIFRLQSAGLTSESDRRLASRIQGVGLIADAGAFLESAKKVQTAAGVGEAGSIQDILSKALVAGKYGIGDVSQIMESTVRGAPLLRGLGMSDEDLTAAVTLLSQTTRSPEMAGTNVASLLRSLTESGQFQGLGIAGSVQKISQLAPTPQAAMKLLGREEAYQAYRNIADNMGAFAQIRGEVDAAQRDNLLNRVILSAETDPTIAMERERNIAMATRTLAEQGMGATRTREQIATDLGVAGAIRRGESPEAAQMRAAAEGWWSEGGQLPVVGMPVRPLVSTFSSGTNSPANITGAAWMESAVERGVRRGGQNVTMGLNSTGNQ